MTDKKSPRRSSRSASSVKKPSSGGPKRGGQKRPPSGGPQRPSGGAEIRSKVPRSAPEPASRPKSSVAKISRPAPVPAPSTATPSQTDARAQQLANARTHWERLAGMVALAALFDQLSSVTSEIDGLDNEIAELRARGYRFGRTMEERAETLQSRWPQQKASANRLLQERRSVLQPAANETQRLLGQAERNTGLLDTVESRLSALENQINEAQRSVQGVFSSTEQDVNELQSEMRQVRALLDALDSASFELLPDEHGVAVCKAQWVSDNQEPEGMLFLTDSRLIFEQREERVIKRKLFSSEKELVQEKLWDTPVGAIDELQKDDKKSGLLGLRRQELLTLSFVERTRELPSDATLHLKGGATNEAWLTLIRQVKSGQIAADLFGAPPPQELLATEAEAEAAEPEAELPTRCPSCNATLPPIYKGMKQVVCQYCGTVVNI
jgi:predicted  nucleic acid-binding Zn-ribbon protein